MYTIIMYINLVHKRKEDMERGCPHSGGDPIGDDSKTKLRPLPNAVPMPTRETFPDVWFGLGCVKVVTRNGFWLARKKSAKFSLSLVCGRVGKP
jgi:hypothetical protein